MNLQSYIQEVVNSSFDRVQSGLANFSSAAPFTGTPLTVLQREALGTKLFTANEYFENANVPNTQNIKTVKTFGKKTNWDTHHFVTVNGSNGFELVALDKKTNTPVSKLQRTFCSFDEADKFLHNLHGVEQKGASGFGGVAGLDRMMK